MVKKLAWKYKVGTDDLLDIIYSVDFNNQDDLANILGVSKRTLESRIKKLKDNKMLWITRDIEKNIYYMLGTDAEKRWTWRECKDIIEYRENAEDSGYQDTIEKNGNGIPFDIMKGQTEEKTVFNSKELDIVVDELIKGIARCK